jgi:ABC-type oligopeptide transport system substrate-binding subunit
MNFREQRPDIELAAAAVAQDLKKNLGIEVKLQTMEWRAYLDKYNNHQLTFVHMRWAADYLDPQNFLSHMLATYGPENKLGYDSPEFDRLCREADSILDMAQRLPRYQRAEDIALNDAVWVPLYFQRDAELQRPWVKGVRESLFGHLPHTTTKIEP